ncbi:MAG: type 1 glutamine amidotransferase [Bacteroidetes bacterium]|nr:type 1 glutamine amidotransferase [Bacteroidota bacterium]
MRKRRAVILQHVPFEGLGSIEPWLRTHGYSLSYVRFFDDYTLPSVENVEALIILGGPMSVNDEQRYPWLKEEKRFVHEVIESNKPTLGICLGAQLIASSLGAKVRRNRVQEIGWFPVSVRNNKHLFLRQLPKLFTAFHWHGETFDIPDGAVHFASSRACEHQAFIVRNKVLALQFHLEVTPAAVRQLLKHCKGEIKDGLFIQSERSILATPHLQYETANALMNIVLEYLFAGDTTE